MADHKPVISKNPRKSDNTNSSAHNQGKHIAYRPADEIEIMPGSDFPTDTLPAFATLFVDEADGAFEKYKDDDEDEYPVTKGSGKGKKSVKADPIKPEKKTKREPWFKARKNKTPPESETIITPLESKTIETAQSQLADNPNRSDSDGRENKTVEAVEFMPEHSEQDTRQNEAAQQDSSESAVSGNAVETIEIDIPAPKFVTEMGGYSRSMVNAYISQISDMMIEALSESERKRKADVSRAERCEQVLIQFAQNAAELIEYYDDKIDKTLVQLKELSEYEKKGTALLEKECARKIISPERLRSMTTYEKRLTTILDRECATLERQKGIIAEWVRDLRGVLEQPAMESISEWLAQLPAENGHSKQKSKSEPSE